MNELNQLFNYFKKTWKVKHNNLINSWAFVEAEKFLARVNSYLFLYKWQAWRELLYEKLISIGVDVRRVFKNDKLLVYVMNEVFYK